MLEMQDKDASNMSQLNAEYIQRRMQQIRIMDDVLGEKRSASPSARRLGVYI